VKPSEDYIFIPFAIATGQKKYRDYDTPSPRPLSQIPRYCPSKETRDRTPAFFSLSEGPSVMTDPGLPGKTAVFPCSNVLQPVFEKIVSPIVDICFLEFTSAKPGKSGNYARFFANYARNPGPDRASGIGATVGDYRPEKYCGLLDFLQLSGTGCQTYA